MTKANQNSKLASADKSSRTSHRAQLKVKRKPKANHCLMLLLDVHDFLFAKPTAIDVLAQVAIDQVIVVHATRRQQVAHPTIGGDLML